MEVPHYYLWGQWRHLLAGSAGSVQAQRVTGGGFFHDRIVRSDFFWPWWR